MSTKIVFSCGMLIYTYIFLLYKSKHFACVCVLCMRVCVCVCLPPPTPPRAFIKNRDWPVVASSHSDHWLKCKKWTQAKSVSVQWNVIFVGKMVLSSMCLAKDERSEYVFEFARLSFILHVNVQSVKGRDTDSKNGCFCFVVLVPECAQFDFFFFLRQLGFFFFLHTKHKKLAAFLCKIS